MSPAHQSTPLPQELGIPVSDRQRTPTTVQGEFLSLLKRVDALESRLNRHSSNSSRPPQRIQLPRNATGELNLPNDASPARNPAIPAIDRSCWNRRRLSPFCLSPAVVDV